MPKPNLTLLNLSEEELDTLAEITEQDIVLAQNFIMRALDDRYKNMLLAQSQEVVEEEVAE